MKGEKENYYNPEQPKIRDDPLQLYTDNVFTYDDTDKRRYLLLPCMPRNMSGKKTRRGARRTNEPWYIDQHNLKEAKIMRKNENHNVYCYGLSNVDTIV